MINSLPLGVENKHKTSILFSATPCSLSVRIARFTVEPDAKQNIKVKSKF